MTIDSSTPTVEVSHAGPVPPASIDRLVDKVRAVTGHCREAVLHIECRLTLIENPAADRPAVAEATLSVNGHPVRAHVAASTPDEAVDLLHDRLARRLERYEDRLHRISERHKTDPVNRAHDPEIQEIPPEDREVRRRKTFPLVPTTVEDAMLDLEQLGHDFYLFQEFETGQTCMIDRDDGEFVLHVEDPAALPDHPLPDLSLIHI